MTLYGGLYLIVQLAKEVGGEGGGGCILELTAWTMPSSTTFIRYFLPVASLESIDNLKGSVDFILVTSLSLSAECNRLDALLSSLTEVAPKIVKF